jgi:hypothetical protein
LPRLQRITAPDSTAFLDVGDALTQGKLSPSVDRQRSFINHLTKQLKARNLPLSILANGRGDDYFHSSFEATAKANLL